ncbi:MAG: DUF3135 domain-containing protein [Candidatus Pacebacteria bacterium]|nr:DUF3135 domain-containing protein [Candidatus Paceibacterota bacterium]
MGEQVLIDGMSFEEWVELFKDNSDEFERKRLALLNAEIEKHPDENVRERLRAVLWEFETRMGKVDNPIARFNAVVADLLGNRLQALNDALNNPPAVLRGDGADIVQLFPGDKE